MAGLRLQSGALQLALCAFLKHLCSFTAEQLHGRQRSRPAVPDKLAPGRAGSDMIAVSPEDMTACRQQPGSPTTMVADS